MPQTQTVANVRGRRLTGSPRSGAPRAVVLVLAVLLATGAAATVVSASVALPTCRVADVMTAQRSYTDWQRTVLDTTFTLPRSYAPGDLRSTSTAGLNAGQTVRRFVILDLTAMATAATEGRCAACGPVGVPQLRDTDIDFPILGQRVGLFDRTADERSGRAQ